jgi:hypothetical protein
MIRFIECLLLAIMTFTIGVRFADSWVTYTTLEEITANISDFEGHWVDVETYAQVDEAFGWTLGESFEKSERLTFIELRDQSTGLDSLHDPMVSRTSNDVYPRIKVLARGLIEDNCNDGIACCFGETMTLKQASITVLNQPEMYSRPKSD